MSYARDTGHWVLRVYSWSTPTLSLGRNQAARGGYDLSRLAEQGIAVVRRPTGGRAILHDREVTYSVAGPVDDAGDLRESYGRINRLLLAGLRTFGARATVVDDGTPTLSEESGDRDRAEPGLLACFHHASRGEITVDGRKLTQAQDLSDVIGVHQPGDSVKLTVVRDGKQRAVTVKLAKRPEKLAQKG